MRVCNNICPICGKRCFIVDPEKGEIPGICQRPFECHDHEHFIFKESGDIISHRWNEDKMTILRIRMGKVIDKEIRRR